MQLLAYLKDSYLEARSGWVLQTMLAILALLVVVVASISFQPVSAPQTVAQQLSIMQLAMRMNPELKTLSFAVENPVIGKPEEPWNSSHEFDIVINAGSAETLKKIKDEPGMPLSRIGMKRIVRDSATVLQKVDVTEVPSEDPKALRFHVTSPSTNAPDITAWPHTPTVLFAIEAPLFTMSLRQAVYAVQKYVMSGVGAWILIFISVVISAGFIPNLLQKGSFDLAVTKPIPRWRLLVYKYLGGLVFIGILTSFAVVGSYLALSLRSGIWNHNFLLAIPIIMMFFAVLYSVSTLAAVFTRSTIVAILVTLGAWLLMYAIGNVNHRIEERAAAAQRNDGLLPAPGEDFDPDALLAKIDPDAPIWGIIPKSMFKPIQYVAAIAPRTYQLDERLGRAIAEGALTPAELKQAKYDKPYPHSWIEILGVSFAFIAVMLAIACWKLNRRDG